MAASAENVNQEVASSQGFEDMVCELENGDQWGRGPVKNDFVLSTFCLVDQP